jgi:hypothetical protein
MVTRGVDASSDVTPKSTYEEAIADARPARQRQSGILYRSGMRLGA